MNRRTFINTLGILGATALLPSTGYSLQSKPKYKMGFQLYSVHQDMNKNPITTLKALKAMGYKDFETAGFDDKTSQFYGLTPSDFKQHLDEMQLTATSGHFWLFPYLEKPIDELKQAVDRCIQGALDLEMKYITWPWLAPEQRTLDHYKLLAEKLNVIGEQVKSAGLGFAYHNHGFEFEDHQGKNGFDIIVRETNPELVKLQLDLYWVMHSSKRSPKELIDQQPGRYVMWHIKDMHKTSRDYTELGNGSINYADILPDPMKSGLEFYYLEQGGNFTHSPMQSAATSADYFKRELQHLL